MNVDLNKPLFLKAVFVKAKDYNCLKCIFSIQGCKVRDVRCAEGHWELDTVFPQSETAFDLIQDSNNSVDSKIQQIKEETKQETEYFY